MIFRCFVNLEVALADRLVLEEVVRVPQGFVAHVALQFGFLSSPHLISSYNQSCWWVQRGHYLHAFWMIIGSVVLDTVPDYLLLTHTALFLTSLPTRKASTMRKITTTRESWTWTKLQQQLICTGEKGFATRLIKMLDKRALFCEDPTTTKLNWITLKHLAQKACSSFAWNLPSSFFLKRRSL